MKSAPVIQQATLREQARKPVRQTCEESGYTNRALAGGPIAPERCQPPHTFPRAGGANSRLHPRIRLCKPQFSLVLTAGLFLVKGALERPARSAYANAPPLCSSTR